MVMKEESGKYNSSCGLNRSRYRSANSMERPRVADARDGLQIWRVTASVMNKQSRTADE
jgi:hypothetical protein